MKRQRLVEGLLFVLLVVVGVQMRIWLQDLPNFAPVAALALFGGYFFRSWALALALPLSVMVLSDLSIGGYDWRMMVVVYSMLALPVAMRSLLRRYLPAQHRSPASAVAAFAGLIGCSLAASVVFFLTTNLGCWLWFDMYEPTSKGLLHCYAMALPFFRYTLAGDMFFAFALFGSYTLATQFGLGTHRQPALSAEVELSAKSVRRILNTLRTVGFPIQETVGEYGRKTYCLAPDGSAPQLSFTFDEALALYLGRKFLQPLAGTLVWDAAQRAFAKVRASLRAPAVRYLDKIGSAFHETSFGLSDYSRHADILDRLLVGIEDRRVVWITYRSRRATEPVTRNGRRCSSALRTCCSRGHSTAGTPPAVFIEASK